MASLKSSRRTLVAILSVLILVLLSAVPALADHSEDSGRGRGHEKDGCEQDKHDGREYDDYGDDGDDENEGDEEGESEGDDGEDGHEGEGDGKEARCDGSEEDPDPSPSPSPSESPDPQGTDDSEDTDDTDDGSGDDTGGDGDDADEEDGAEEDSAADANDEGDQGGAASSTRTGSGGGGTTTSSSDGGADGADSTTRAATTTRTATTSSLTATSDTATTSTPRPATGPLICPDGTDFAGFLTGSLADCDSDAMSGGWSGTFLAAQGVKVCKSGPFKGMPVLDESECDYVLGKRLMPLTGAGGVLPLIGLAVLLIMMGSTTLKVRPKT